MIPPLLQLGRVAYSFFIISRHWQLLTQVSRLSLFTHITDIYITTYTSIGDTVDPCLPIHPHRSLVHLATLAELAGRNDGRLGHVTCTVWSCPAIGVITLLREVCFNCYLLRLAWLLKPSSLTPSRFSHVGNWRLWLCYGSMDLLLKK